MLPSSTNTLPRGTTRTSKISIMAYSPFSSSDENKVCGDSLGGGAFGAIGFEGFDAGLDDCRRFLQQVLARK